MAKAVYAFSADPITFGHIDIIKRAASAFELIVAVGNNPSKKYLFSLEERTDLVKEALGELPGLEVTSFRGMLVDFAYEQDARYIVRGLRNSEDFNFELLLYQVGSSQRLGIETIFFPTSAGKSHISSGVAKAVQKEQGLIHEFVPLNVKLALEERISSQRIIGITGTIAAGKSTFCREIVASATDEKPIHHIDLDVIGHDIMEKYEEPVYQTFRRHLIETFGETIAAKDGFINRKALGEIVFNDPDQLATLNQLFLDPIVVGLRRQLYQREGVILIEGALLIEAELTHLCNNELVVLQVDEEVQKKRLAERDFSAAQIERRIASQYNHAQKMKRINEIIKRDRFGKVLTVEDLKGICDSFTRE